VKVLADVQRDAQDVGTINATNDLEELFSMFTSNVLALFATDGSIPPLKMRELLGR
jgi:hypothetical protein